MLLGRRGHTLADVARELLHDAIGLLAHDWLAELADLPEHAGVRVDHQLGLVRGLLDERHRDGRLDTTAHAAVGALRLHRRPSAVTVALDDADLALEAQGDRPDS